jgi:uncharacterized protein (DUF1330 family)
LAQVFIRVYFSIFAGAANDDLSQAKPSQAKPSQAAAIGLLRRGITGEVVMLNLLRLRDVADYSATPELAPAEPISGAAAYERYIAEALPHLRASGGDVLFWGEGGPWLIGPEHEQWDRALLVRQHSVQAFLAFANNEQYLACLAHRTAAVADSRLLPLIPLPVAPGEVDQCSR